MGPRRKLKRTIGVNRKIQQLGMYKRLDGNFEFVRIHSKDDRPLWTLFMEFFRSLEIGQEFSRSELLSATYEKNAVPAVRGRETTVDHYRLYLSKLGVITHVKTGIHKKVFNLPKGITLTKITKALKHHSKWKEWFIPLHEKLGISEEDLK